MNLKLTNLVQTNFYCLLLVGISAFLAGVAKQLVTFSILDRQMDSPAREAFLASVVAEEDWLETVSRRLSVGSQSIPEPLPAFDSPAAASEQADSSAGPLRRSGRKRKLTSDPIGPRRNRMSASAPPPQDKTVLEQLQEMMREMKEVREDVNKSNVTTSTKIDSLSKKMTDRLGKTEQSVKCLSQDLAAVRTDISKVKRKASEEGIRMERMIEDLVDRKLATTRPDAQRRPRPTGTLTGANLTPLSITAGRNSKEDDYLLPLPT